MKYLLAFFAALVVVGVSAVPFNGNRTDLFNGNRSDIFSETFLDIFNGNYTPSLEKEFWEFRKLIPADKFGAIVEHFKNDPEIINGINYLHHKHFHGLVYNMEALPEFHRLVHYLQESGFDIIKKLKIFHLIVGMEDYVPPPKPSHNVFKREANFESGFKGYIKAIIAILPVKEIKELHNKKLKESESFAKFSSYIKSQKFSEICTDLGKRNETKELVHNMKLVGMDVIDIGDLHLRMLGFRY